MRFGKSLSRSSNEYIISACVNAHFGTITIGKKKIVSAGFYKVTKISEFKTWFSERWIGGSYTYLTLNKNTILLYKITSREYYFDASCINIKNSLWISLMESSYAQFYYPCNTRTSLIHLLKSLCAAINIQTTTLTFPIKSKNHSALISHSAFSV